MENFTITKSEYGIFISSVDELIDAVRKLISFTGSNDELLSDNIAMQKFIDMYFETSTQNPNKISEMRLPLYALMGQAIIFWIGGEWKLCTLKKDEAYETPIILGWGDNGNRPRISPKVWEIIMMEDNDREMFINLLESFKDRFPKG